MKKTLTYEEISYIIKSEDACGVNTLLQEIFQYTDKTGEVKLGKDIEVICDIDNDGNLGKYEVRRIE